MYTIEFKNKTEIPLVGPNFGQDRNWPRSETWAETRRGPQPESSSQKESQRSQWLHNKKLKSRSWHGDLGVDLLQKKEKKQGGGHVENPREPYIHINLIVFPLVDSFLIELVCFIRLSSIHCIRSQLSIKSIFTYWKLFNIFVF